MSITSNNTLSKNDDLKETASIFWLEIKYWEKVELWEIITIPSSYKNLDINTQIWFCLLLKSMWLNKDQDFLKSELTSDFEHSQITYISQIIFSFYFISKKYLLTDTSKHTKKFIEKLKNNLLLNENILFKFLWENLENLENFRNKSHQKIYDFLVLNYINYKSSNSFNEKDTNNNSKSNDWRAENDDLKQQDIEFWEQAEWQDNWVFCYFKPKIKWSFLYSSQVFETYNKKTNRFENAKKDKTEIYPNHQLDKISIMYYTANIVWKMYSISLPKWYKVSSFDNSKVKVYTDKYRKYYLTPLIPWEHKLDISIDEKNYDENNFWELSKDIIYSWNNIPRLWNNPFEILSYIKKHKKYKETNQKKILDISFDTNSYFENIYLATEIECLTANMFFVAMCRNIWFPSRVIYWISSYNSYLSNNRWHAWSEVFIDWKWIELDATPTKKDDKDNKDNSWESIEEMCGSFWWDEKDSDDEKLSGEKLNWVNYWESLQIEEIKQWASNILNLSQNLDELTSSAIKFVYNDYINIVKSLKSILDIRNTQLLKRKLWQKPKNFRSWLNDWELKITANTIQSLATWNTAIFQKMKRLKPNLDNDIDTLPNNISIAIDISGSMWRLNWNWNNPEKMESAYLSLVLLALICNEFNIDFNVVLFSDQSFTIKEKLIVNKSINPKFFNEIINIMWTKSSWNEANSSWIYDMLKTLYKSKKWIWIILSDWDWNNNAFFTKNWISQKVIEEKNIVVFWYWLWKDASFENWYIDWKITTVIGNQLNIWLPNKSRWYPLEDYEKIVQTLRGHLSAVFTQENMKLR